MRTRDEHVEWCKVQARYHLERGDVKEAITCMLSDLSKHEETKGIGSKMTMLGIYYISNGDIRDARRFVEGFR